MSEPVRNSVLIVDDEMLIRMILAEEIEDVGLIPLEANNAEEALAILDSRPEVRVLFTDINMPGAMNGLELARIVRDRWPLVQVYFASGGAQHSADRGEATFIEKPYSAANVAEMIRKGLESAA